MIFMLLTQPIFNNVSFNIEYPGNLGYLDPNLHLVYPFSGQENQKLILAWRMNINGFTLVIDHWCQQLLSYSSTWLFICRTYG